MTINEEAKQWHNNRDLQWGSEHIEGKAACLEAAGWMRLDNDKRRQRYE